MATIFITHVIFDKIMMHIVVVIVIMAVAIMCIIVIL
jgi:hypothetical protein